MSDGFQVVMSDLLSASSTFRVQSRDLDAIMPADGPACPDGGAAVIDAAMRMLAQTIGVVHQRAATALDGHAEKLVEAHTNYASTEESLTQLSRQIDDPARIR
jgi:Family of unknown function (DUF6317)